MVFNIFTNIKFQNIQLRDSKNKPQETQNPAKMSLRKVSSLFEDVNQVTWRHRHIQDLPRLTYLSPEPSTNPRRFSKLQTQGLQKEPQQKSSLTELQSRHTSVGGKEQSRLHLLLLCGGKPWWVHCSRAMEAIQGGRRLAGPFRHPGVALLIKQPCSYKSLK